MTIVVTLGTEKADSSLVDQLAVFIIVCNTCVGIEIVVISSIAEHTVLVVVTIQTPLGTGLTANSD